MVLTLLTLIAAVLDTILATIVWTRFGRTRAARCFIGTIAIRLAFAFSQHVYLPAAISPRDVAVVACLRWVLLPLASLCQLLFFLSIYEEQWLTRARTYLISAAFVALAAALSLDVARRAAPLFGPAASLSGVDPFAIKPQRALLVLFNLSWIPGVAIIARKMVVAPAERRPLLLVLGTTIAGMVLGGIASKRGALGDAAVLFDVIITSSLAYLLYTRRIFETTRIAIDSALSAMAEGVAVLSPDGRVLFANPAMERQTRLHAGDTAEAIGSDPMMGELLRHLEGERVVWPIESRERQILVSANPIKDPDGRLHGHMLLAQDVTDELQRESEILERNVELSRANEEQRRLLAEVEEGRRNEEQAHSARHRAEAASAAKSAFLAHMSHELRTPLNAILGFSQLMARDKSLAPEPRRQLAIIERSGHHLLELINGVLDLSKIEAGKLELTETRFSPARVLVDIEHMFREKAREKDLSLTVHADPALPAAVRGDLGKLRQILINLVGNALKFTERGGVTVRAFAPVLPEEAVTGAPVRLCFKVEDTGPGLDEAAQRTLFQAFATVGLSHVTPGTGLGLAISRELCRALGGEMRVESTSGKGATFSFDVLCALATEADRSSELERRRVLSLAADEKSRRMLVCDDREENRELLVQLLAAVGFEVRSAENGREAVEEWQAWHPHLIWMDMRMPIMDGYEATRRIREATGGHSTVIIALTASAFEQDRATVMSAGCDDFVRKPLREAEIFEAAARHLGVRYEYEKSVDALDIEAFAAEASPDGGLAALPEPLRERLRRAAESLRAKDARAAIAELPPEQAELAARLEELVATFRFDRILTLLDRGTES